ncbi:nuclear transport factor 2 family protein [Streptomyces sp. NPDC002187]|uniref:nuclear transport factor 2 family protein n=1 Tax=Streptomyces sp. NPDC002187 TaxID=3364637 RepID=UPI00369370C2
MSEDRGPEGVAELLRAALTAHDTARLATLLDPGVRWGGEEDTDSTCHSRDDVLRWYAGLRAAGVRTRVDEVLVHGQAVILGTSIDWPHCDDPDEERPDRLFHVFRIRGGLVYDIRGCPDLQQALADADTVIP